MLTYFMLLLQFVLTLVALFIIVRRTNDRSTFLAGVTVFWTCSGVLALLVLIGLFGGAEWVGRFVCGG